MVDVRNLRKLAAAATAGDWRMDNHFSSPWISVGELSNLVYIFKCGTREDAAYIMAMHSALPALLAAYEITINPS